MCSSLCGAPVESITGLISTWLLRKFANYRVNYNKILSLIKKPNPNMNVVKRNVYKRVDIAVKITTLFLECEKILCTSFNSKSNVNDWREEKSLFDT